MTRLLQIDRYRIAAIMLGARSDVCGGDRLIPAFVDSDGEVFGLFHLDIYKDALHVASGLGR